MEQNSYITIEVDPLATVSGQMTDPISLDFVTELSPLLSSPLRVRKIAGAYLEEFDDFIIYQLLFTYSLEATLRSPCNKLDTSWLLSARKWVAYKTILDLLYNSDNFAKSGSGKSSKKLGDFSISGESSTAGSEGPMGKMISKIECEIFKLNPAILNCMPELLSCENKTDLDLYVPKKSQLVIKGGNVPRPLMGRTIEASRLDNPLLDSFIIENGRMIRTN